MTYQPPPGTAPPPAPEGYPQQVPPPAYAPPVKPRKKREEIISNGLIIAMVMLAGILILVSAIIAHSTRFLDDAELIKNMGTVSLILLDVAMFLLVVFLVLAAVMRSDIHHWVRAALVVLAAFILSFYLAIIYYEVMVSLITGMLPSYP
ncbi:MAG: hypothetical protein ACE5QW_00615 [Thermoplasmata archaeon]